MIDVDKLLQFEYLNDLMIQITSAIKEKEKLFISKYSFSFFIIFFVTFFRCYFVSCFRVFGLIFNDFRLL